MEILLSCLALFFVSIGGARLFSYFFASNTDEIIQANIETNKTSVFLKKYNQVDIDKWETTNRLIGLVLTLAFLLVGVESFTKHETFKIDHKPIVAVDSTLVWVDAPKEIYTPPQPKKEVPPPPKPLTIVKIDPIPKPLDHIPNINREEKIEIPLPKIPIAVPTIINKPPTITTPAPPITVKKEADALKEVIHEWASQPPVFDGGLDALRKQVQKAYKIPRNYIKSGEKGGTITTRFVVQEDGTIGQIEIIKGLNNCTICDEEAIRAIRNIDGRFTPGKQAGKPVKVWFILPISVRIR